MSLHPRSFLPRAQTRALWICASCLARTSRTQHPLPPLRRRSNRLRLPPSQQTASFHASAHRLAPAPPTHYQVLELKHDASAGEIKRQFYTLSKKHHPDHNASDPDASTRFVAISEAYHVLSVPEKRAQYDAQLSHAHAHAHARSPHWGSHAPAPQGSYSSASYAGSRPASGLNKKRSTFRGPPPSFYKAGGYGRHGAKRAEFAQHQHAGHRTEQNANTSSGDDSYGGFGDGLGPGQAAYGNEVPHFDDRKHKQMHDTVYEHIYARKRRERDAEIPQEFDRGGMLANFLIVSGVVAIAAAVTKMFSTSTEGSKKANA
ncbi:DnaJ-domain-containing protein [Karstenula rhodostoma CBS 690.94]|uniref:DnaJ-domain-containing protein n=1 Tax=Karstenula rhodostoma CBS 690.94 TaxID=1392251 RepID=A0A9P4UAB6_9PLEO|nr:DnaJ-domain-containing protein [Karstenula rhodostoma CBS 690.94]